MITKPVTIGVYLTDYEKAQERGFKHLVQMVYDGEGTYTHSEGPVIYKTLRLPGHIIEKIRSRAWEMDKTIVSYTAGVFHSLVN